MLTLTKSTLLAPNSFRLKSPPSTTATAYVALALPTPTAQAVCRIRALLVLSRPWRLPVFLRASVLLGFMPLMGVAFRALLVGSALEVRFLQCLLRLSALQGRFARQGLLRRHPVRLLKVK